MAFTKEKIYKTLIFAYLVLFPFGQILRTSVTAFDKNIRVHPADFVVTLIFLLWIFERSTKPKIYPRIIAFAVTALFSLLFSLSILHLRGIVIGAIYLFRVFAYLSVFLITWDIVK